MHSVKEINTNNLLRLSTVGSVDDGKSTLIGQLLFQSRAILKDQYQSLVRASEKNGEEEVNLAYLTDGLKAERELGITIDVAYRYFSTARRKFILADTPGHVQYTRNMVTGASTANVVLILIDVRKGLTEQTKRHVIISSLLQIPHFIVCINKMDLVNYDKKPYEQIKSSFQLFASKLEVTDIHFIPISALKGENITKRAENLSWYQGPTLLYLLENIHISGDQNYIDCRFPIQTVIRPQSEAFHDYRAYAGRVASGIFKRGDRVKLLPAGTLTTIKRIETYDGEISEALPGQSVSILLEGEFDLSRGDILVREHNQPNMLKVFDAMIIWFDDRKSLNPNGKYLIRHTTSEVKCRIKTMRYKMDVNTLHRDEEDKNIRMNDIARIQIECAEALYTDPYSKNRITGSLIMIDEQSHNTVAAGMVI